MNLGITPQDLTPSVHDVVIMQSCDFENPLYHLWIVYNHYIWTAGTLTFYILFQILVKSLLHGRVILTVIHIPSY